MTVAALLLQFGALGHQAQIMKDHEDQVSNNLFSFVIIMGIVVCVFKLLSDCMLIYGAKHVSHPHRQSKSNALSQMIMNLFCFRFFSRFRFVRNENKIAGVTARGVRLAGDQSVYHHLCVPDRCVY